ncbi:hypothetical protein NNRS527_01593 [Nitrosospira sp. NRS527]|nr:hypothetical protein NNRS527_01593 [Nitrosospira sp. NRS527]
MIQPGSGFDTPYFLEISVIKLPVVLFIFGLAYSGQAPAQEWEAATPNAAASAPAEMAQESPFIYPLVMNNPLVPLGASHKQDQRLDRSSLGGPVVVLPMPPMGGSSGYNNMHGFQYPGSYMPRDTPLHKFNGYVACAPPDLAGETAAVGTTTGAPARRLVKITSTRSLAAPAYQQPCPVYTVNGEIPKQQGYTTTTRPSGRNAPQTMR